VWDSFDRRKQAKAANDGGVAADAAAAEAEANAAGDMFTRAGVAAE
jgi:hypothetical protein